MRKLAECCVALYLGWYAIFAAHLSAQNNPMRSGLVTTGWMNSTLSPEDRVELVLRELTLDEKIALLHGNGMARVKKWQMPLTHSSNQGAGYIAPIPRLDIPGVDMSDAAYGVRSSGDNGRYSVALPSNLASASSWDTEAACRYGSLIGRELRAQGYSMSLGGGANLARDPRNGRTFEYLGEDPLLVGTLVGERIRCEGAEHVITDIKHFALNDQETGRSVVDARISRKAMRESDLLAFQIGIDGGHPDAVMCSYNLVNGIHACENDYLLNQILKTAWRFPGFVLSDWEGTHSTIEASHAGLDQEQPMDTFFGNRIKVAVQEHRISDEELDDHVRRILRAYFVSGIMDHPVHKFVVDAERELEISESIEDGSIVLLRNENHILPLDSNKIRSVVLIGSHADLAMLSGGGSAQVDAPGGNSTISAAQHDQRERVKLYGSPPRP